jgi:hypothetical protein
MNADTIDWRQDKVQALVREAAIQLWIALCPYRRVSAFIGGSIN